MFALTSLSLTLTHSQDKVLIHDAFEFAFPALCFRSLTTLSLCIIHMKMLLEKAKSFLQHSQVLVVNLLSERELGKIFFFCFSKRGAGIFRVAEVETENWSISYIMHALHNKLARREENMQQNSKASLNTMMYDVIDAIKCVSIFLDARKWMLTLRHKRGNILWVGVYNCFKSMKAFFEGFFT